MDNEELKNFFNNLSGKQKVEMWMNSMLGTMANHGFKPAEIQMLQLEIQTLIQDNIMKKYVLILNTDEKKLDEIKVFLKNIKEQIIDFSNELDEGE